MALIDEEEQELADIAYWQRLGRFIHRPGTGQRDVRSGNRWLPWHASPDFEASVDSGVFRTCGGVDFNKKRK